MRISLSVNLLDDDYLDLLNHDATREHREFLRRQLKISAQAGDDEVLHKSLLN